MRGFRCGIVPPRQQQATVFLVVREAVVGGAVHGAGRERAGRRGALPGRRDRRSSGSGSCQAGEAAAEVREASEARRVQGQAGAAGADRKRRTRRRRV